VEVLDSYEIDAPDVAVDVIALSHDHRRELGRHTHRAVRRRQGNRPSRVQLAPVVGDGPVGAGDAVGTWGEEARRVRNGVLRVSHDRHVWGAGRA
jgi:hypothetical protein